MSALAWVSTLVAALTALISLTSIIAARVEPILKVGQFVPEII
jgi:hypothetical protein